MFDHWDSYTQAIRPLESVPFFLLGVMSPIIHHWYFGGMFQAIIGNHYFLQKEVNLAYGS